MSLTRHAGPCERLCLPGDITRGLPKEHAAFMYRTMRSLRSQRSRPRDRSDVKWPRLCPCQRDSLRVCKRIKSAFLHPRHAHLHHEELKDDNMFTKCASLLRHAVNWTSFEAGQQPWLRYMWHHCELHMAIFPDAEEMTGTNLGPLRLPTLGRQGQTALLMWGERGLDILL